MIQIDAGRQEVLERSALVFPPEAIELRFELGLPAAGRSVLGREAERLLLTVVPDMARNALLWASLPGDEMRAFVACVEDQEAIRAQLPGRGLVAFVADGAILPRESGASDRPMQGESIVAFESPPALRARLDLPGGRTIEGMGVPEGVTVIVGGGYHGKSTLLRALERAVYPHVPGDGREYVVSRTDLVKIRAEDGRRVEGVDIRPFISDLPGGRSTAAFCSDDASGSTSQAANIIEAIEAGAGGLLLDEDTSATNFMIRDSRMQRLVAREHEPITPFIDRVRDLYERLGVSSVLVMGGSGDYFDVADHVIMMREYHPSDVTEGARRIAADHRTERNREPDDSMGAPRPRIPIPSSFDASRGRREVKISARDLDRLEFGTEPVELRGVEQLVDRSQTRAIGLAIHQATQRFMNEKTSLSAVLDALDSWLDEAGLDDLDPFRTGRRSEEHPGNLARPRRFEIAAAINRLRTLRIRQAEGSD